MMEQKNVVLAIVLSAIILFGSQFIIEHYFPQPHPSQTVSQTTDNTTPGAGPAVEPGAPAAVAEQSRATVIAETPRVAIRTDSLIGTISLLGGRLDDLTLARYRETVDPKSPQMGLLSPPGARDAYYADFSWLSDAGANIKLPDSNTRWTADNQTLTVDHPVTLTWDNGQGLTFTRHFAVDQYYMFTVTDSVKNSGTAAVKLYPYGRIRRVGTPKTLNYYLLHEGLLG